MKKILFILLSIFCFIGITNAKDYKDLKEKWMFENNFEVQYFEEIEDYFIVVDDSYIWKLRKDGTIKEKLKGIIGYVTTISDIDDKKIVISIESTDDGRITHVYVLNKKYEIIDQDQIFTGSMTIDYLIEDGNYYLGDYNNPAIELDDYKIVKPNEDNDGNYTIVLKNTIIKISKDNEIIKEITGTYTTQINDYYYSIDYTTNATSGYDIIVTKYNKNLEQVDSKVTNTSSFPYRYIQDNNTIYVISDNYYKVNDLLELEKVSTYPREIYYNHIYTKNMTSDDEKSISDAIKQKIQTNLPENGELNVLDINQGEENSLVAAGIFYSYDDEKITNYIYLQYYDTTGRLVFNKTIYTPPAGTNNYQFDLCSGYNVSVTRIDEDIFLVYQKYQDYMNVYLEIYDLKGNLKDSKIYDFSNDVAPRKIRKTNNGLLLIIDNHYKECEVNNFSNSIIPSYLSQKNIPDVSIRLNYSAIYYYEFPFEVTTKSDGNGTITATKVKALSGEVIEYEVKPKEGYVLGEVKVIDEYGNVITFTNNKFTMPSANVTIEASFVVENVDTADIAICTILILGLIGVFFIVSNKTKINYINN